MGTATTSIQSIDPLTGARLPIRTFEANAEAVIADPITGEANPFNLVITSTTNVGGLPPVGGVSFLSAGSFATSTGNFLAQYWEIDIVAQGQGVREFEGVLRENSVEGAIAFNTIDLPLPSLPGINVPLPVTIAEGAEITGAFTSTGFQAIIEGTTTQLDSFVIEINDNDLVIACDWFLL